jgi:phosphoribosylformimino-5-aminoimidazole carboxamide ribotide isomerase
VRCIFVLDLFNGTVVHAVRGERSRYEPIEKHSRIVKSSDPIEIMREVMPREAYVADLNKITGSGNNLQELDKISSMTSTMADIGISRRNDLEVLPIKVTPVLGTETASMELISQVSKSREVVVSLDMKMHQVLTSDPSITLEPLDLLGRFNDLPLKSIIILELDRVGTSSGLDNDFLEMAARISDHPLILGGGVKDVEDLASLERLGFEGALVATAVHNGRIPLEILR